MSASDNKLDRPIEFHRRDTSRLDAALRRTQADGQTTDKNGLDLSRIPSPSSKSGIRPRRTFGKTSTLTGAFEATAPQQEQQPAAIGTPSPSSRRIPGRSRSSTNPVEDVSSPPELQETYRQINDSDDLVNLVAHDDFDPPDNTEQAQTDRRRRKSPNQRAERQQPQEEQNYKTPHDPAESQGSGLSFPEDDTDDSFRNKLEQFAMDEQRLKRVTAKESPVFSKAKVGQNGSRAAGHLKRRSQEGDDEGLLKKDGPEPSLNIPKAWGGRGQASKERMSYISRRNMEQPVEKPHFENVKTEPDLEPEPEPAQDWENDIDFTARDLQVSDSPPVQQNFIPAREETNTLARKAVTNKRLGELNRKFSQEQIHPSVEEGDPIPNTPIVVYKNNSNYEKKMERTDSRDILRELAMRESPSMSSSNTPEQKSPEKNVMLAKTPVVTGAWIDTPMTEKVAELPEDLTRDIVSTSPSKTVPKSEKQKEEEQPQAPEQKPPLKSSSEPKSEPSSKPASGQSSQTTSKSSTKLKPKPQRRQLEKPKIPKSALETVLESAKSDDNALSFGEDTIDSLREILNEEPSIFSPDGGNNDPESDETSVSTHTVTDPSNSALHPLNSKLQSLLRSIHDAQQGLSSLEHQITSEAAPRLPEKKKEKRMKSPKATHDPSTCETCGLHDHDRRVYVSIPLPRLWRRIQPSNRLRPTLLGYFLLISVTWFIVEFTMCDYYCHPFFAYSCEFRNCHDRFAPRMPFVLPTMLWRWSKLQVVWDALWVVIVAMTRITLQLFGLWDGFVDDGAGGGYWSNRPVRKEPVGYEVPVARTWGHDSPQGATDWVPDLSMNDDEYI